MDLFISLNNIIHSAVAFPLLEFSDRVVVFVSIEFPSNSKGYASSIAKFLIIFMLNGV